MKKKVEKYTGNKIYVFPNGALATREAVLKQFPAALDFVHVVETDEGGEVLWAFENLSAMCSIHGIDRSLSEEEKIAKFQEIINTEPEVDTTPTAEERIASALEFQVMASLPDESIDETVATETATE